MGSRVVVIGGDAAGMTAASALRRRLGDDDEVIVLERGTRTSYSACGIPYWIAGEVGSVDDLVVRTPEEHRANGIDVYVSTASLEDVVGVFASNPKYGFNVARENVLGLRLERDGEVFKNAYLKNWPLNWGPGKTEVIKRELVARKGYGPIFVAGDSDGDYDMLRDFPDTKLSVIVNRMKKGKIGELSKLAAAQLQAPQPRYLLQGRQESTGNWLPVESSIKYGKNELLLTA